jgi:hypothetical protein
VQEGLLSFSYFYTLYKTTLKEERLFKIKLLTMNETYGGEESTTLSSATPKGHTGGGGGGGPMDNEEDNLVLWVGNLDSRATENMIYELFCQVNDHQ